MSLPKLADESRRRFANGEPTLPSSRLALPAPPTGTLSASTVSPLSAISLRPTCCLVPQKILDITMAIGGHYKTMVILYAKSLYKLQVSDGPRKPINKRHINVTYTLRHRQCVGEELPAPLPRCDVYGEGGGGRGFR